MLIINLSRHMPESIIREELEVPGIRVQSVKLSSGRRHQDVTKHRPPSPHFVVSVARGPQVQKVRALSELCGDIYGPQRPCYSVSVANALATCSATADTRPAVACGESSWLQG